ncbi:uncharacterized protein VNE69_01179 [Vairimorpha necatrix]|uniref:Uncharacterized protein n=1 Tax=Vairimorpha necatrix TaxID=6039 RepID=A0AAX4J8G4_9MICR
MKDEKKFYMSGIQDFIDEIRDDNDLYFKYGVYLANTGEKFDFDLFNDKKALLNFMKKQRISVKPKKNKLEW